MPTPVPLGPGHRIGMDSVQKPTLKGSEPADECGRVRVRFVDAG